MPNIPYPNVPNAPGVPNVPVNPVQPNGGVIVQPTLTVNKESTVTNINSQVWKIVDNKGAIVLDADTYNDFNIRAEAVIPNYPIEEGGFSSYNQVDKPYGLKLTAIVSGNEDISRAQFIDQVVELKESLTLVTIVTPDGIFDDAKLISYSYSNKANQGLTILMVEMIFQEVRQTASAVVTAAKPSGQAKVKTGQVSPVPPTNQQASNAKPLAFKP